MKETIKRKRYLDVYRGIAMILVVLGHSVGTIQDPINWYIISFHMPVFFFISGICFNLSSNKGSISDGIIHKITTLGYQYLVFSLLGLTFYWLIRSRLGNDLNISLFSSFAGLLVGYNIVPGFWFVFDLFVISVLFIMTQNIPNKGFIWVLTSFLFFVVCSYYRDSFIYNEIIHRIMGGGVFYGVGVLFGLYDKGIYEYLMQKNRLLSIAVMMLLFFLMGVIAYHNIPVVMERNEYGNIWLFILGSLIACVAIFILSVLINKNIVLEYIGVNSILFLFVHFYILDISHFGYNTLFGSGFNNSFPYYFLHFVIALIGCFCFSWIVNKYAPFLKNIHN